MTNSWVTMTDNVTISGCISKMGGGAMLINQGAVVVFRGESLMSGCSASASSGGALFIDGASVTIEDATLQSCSAFYTGGAVYAGLDSKLVMTRAKLHDNSASNQGGAVHVDRSDAELVNVDASSNKGGHAGGFLAVSISVLGHSTRSVPLQHTATPVANLMLSLSLQGHQLHTA